MFKKMMVVLITIVVLMLLACGGGEDKTSSSQTAEKAASPDVTEIIIRPVGNEMKYETSEFTVKAGSKVRIIMDNIATLDAMVHNVVIMKPGSDGMAVGMAGLQAGEAKGYIPDDPAILFYTGLAKPGQKTQVEFTAPPAGDYPYVCTFPGHFSLMKGVMHSVN